MTIQTMQQCLDVLATNPNLQTVDLTGGAPEMNPNFRWFVEEIKKLDRHIIVRCNLTIIRANKKYYDLPEFYKLHNIEVVSSLPFYSKDRTDKQRGDGVFEDSINALQMLNAVGYGLEGSALLKDFGIHFHDLFAITNLPISRFLDYLLESGNYEGYMEKLVDSYNPVAAANVMCRSTISIGWDGYLYDCDFNQMLELKVACKSKHISDYNATELQNRNIIVSQHCYGCTAGAGSSCGGAVA
jgi:MoaA/NifB/PqqE/SkfB family radical SAM enzyme